MKLKTTEVQKTAKERMYGITETTDEERDEAHPFMLLRIRQRLRQDIVVLHHNDQRTWERDSGLWEISAGGEALQLDVGGRGGHPLPLGLGHHILLGRGDGLFPGIDRLTVLQQAVATAHGGAAVLRWCPEVVVRWRGIAARSNIN